MKKIFKITFGVLLLFFITFYLCVVCVLPSIINSKAAINKLQSSIHNKTGIETNITGLNLKIFPMLTLVLRVDSIDAKNNNISAADIKNLSLKYKLLQKRLAYVSADNIFIDGNCFKGVNKRSKRKNSRKSKLNNIPEIHIQKFVFKSDEVSVNAQDINTDNDLIRLKAAVGTPSLKEGVKLGNSGSLQAEENELKANKFEIAIGNSHLYLDGILIGKNKSRDLDINGEKLPVSEIMPALLHFQKSKDPSKKFIENFKNF
jgi:hypothetical protein